MSAPRRLLVTGATGKQGGALISALLAKPTQSFEIYALTRSKSSSKAKQLASYPNVKVIEGNLDEISAVFAQIEKPVWGVFAVPVLDKGVKKEEEQGQALIDAAVTAGVSHVVFTATDRGGPSKSEGNPSPVPHFASKYHIEEFIKAKAAESNGKLTWTFLRPAAFFENFEPGFFGSAHMAMWRINGDAGKLQMVSTKDIGKVAAEAFLHADQPKYKNGAISLAGDYLSPVEVAQVFNEVTGKTIPQAWFFVAYPLRYLIYDLRMMYWWFKAEGFAVDIPALRKEYPSLQDFRTWLKEDSQWSKK